MPNVTIHVNKMHKKCTLEYPTVCIKTYLLYCFILFSLSLSLLLSYCHFRLDLLRCPYLSCDIWIVASNIYLLYLHFNKSRVRAFSSSNLFWERERQREYRHEQHKMFAINHMILGEKLFSKKKNFIPFGYTLSVHFLLHSFLLFASSSSFFFDVLLYTILLVPSCTLSSSRLLPLL